jgi:large subunit ribosomal protein L24
MHIKKGDTVVVLSGDDKGVKGEVIAVSPEEGKVIVKGVNIIHKHIKPRKQGETGGIVDAEGAIYASNVALVCPKCGKAARVMHKITSDDKHKRIVTRVAAHKNCGYPEI